MITLSYGSPANGPLSLDSHRSVVLCGKKAALLSLVERLPEALARVFPAMVKALRPKDVGDATATWLTLEGAGDPKAQKVVVVCLPEIASRYNSPGRPDAIPGLVGKHLPDSGETGTVVLCLENKSQAFAAGCAVARACPTYTHKSNPKAEPGHLEVQFVCPPGEALGPEEVARISLAADGIRRAAHLVDMPASELSTSVAVREAERLGRELGAEVVLIQGEELARVGLCGLYSVGRAATSPPALVQLSYGPKDAAERVVLVGKGIVYDTGGLALKGKFDMPGMKADMGGAAAVFGAFSALVRSGRFANARLHALLCLAENAVGPLATRPDDIIRLYSGKTIEVNNPDAEGRLVVGDGVAYAGRHLSPSVIVDLATLTGAQLIATGKRHAAVVSNDPDWEEVAVRAGRSSGDLLHPLPYCPEFFRREFKSEVADLKNSVKDRNNAQSACAAQFIAEQLGEYTGPWIHIDMAGPVVREERATGFGVALLLEMFGKPA